MDTKKRRINEWLIIPVFGIIVFCLTRLFIHFPHLVESFYSQNIYPVIATLLSSFSILFPFSVDDVFYISLILAGLLITIFTISGKISIRQSFLLILNILAAVYVLFYVLWGFNYFRIDLNSRLGIEEQKANQQEFKLVFRTLIETTNNSYTSFDEFNEEEIALHIEQSYSRFAPILKIKYPGGKRIAKPVTFSGFFAQAGISGYYGPFFNEIHINTKLLPVEYPFVLAHEKAHQFGITGEAEANFFAWLVCSQSKSKHLQYSANIIALRYFMVHGRRLEGYGEEISKIDERVVKDIRRIYEHWQALRNAKVEAVAERVNDAYLKSNQVEEGIMDYTGIVKYIMDFSLDTTFRKGAGI